MGKSALVWVLAALWLSATTPAEACPAGSPCLKYRREARTVNVQPDYFARASGGTIPTFDRKKLSRYLTSSRWKPMFDNGEALFASPAGSRGAGTGATNKITYVKNESLFHFVDPGGKIPTAKGNERVVLIRQIERDSDGNVFIDVDGVAYQLWYCVSGKRTTPCLTNTGFTFTGMFPTDRSDDDQPLLKPLPF